MDCVKEGKKVTIKQNTIKPKNHSLGTYHQAKKAMTSYDTKRWISDDDIHTRAHGHIKSQQEREIRNLETEDLLDSTVD